MKRLFFAAAVIGLALLGAGCAGEPEMQTVCSDFGIQVTLPADMAPWQGDSEYNVFLLSDSCAFAADKDAFASHGERREDVAALSLEDYAELVRLDNGINDPFVPNAKGDLCAGYTVSRDSGDVFHYCVLRKGSDAFWVATFACAAEDMEEFLPQFETWAAGIKIK